MVSVFEKVSKVKRLIVTAFPDEQEDVLIDLLRNVAKWHYSKKKKLLSLEQAKLYELLINGGYNPDTVYKWFLLVRSPFDLREKLKLKLVGQREAFAKKREMNSLASTSHQQLLQEIMQSVERYVVR